MAALLQTASGVLRYRGGVGQWAWAIHRAAGLGVLAFLLLHIVDIFLTAFGPKLFNDLLFLYTAPWARVLEVFLLFGLLYHALNGLRIILADFMPILASRTIARNFFYVQLAVFLVLFVPGGYFMLVTAKDDLFGGNAFLALGITFLVLALPAVIVGTLSLMPSAAGTPMDSDSTRGNYQDGIARILASRKPRVMNRTELNIWLFMRISGFLLIILALFHFFLMHFVTLVDDINFNYVLGRWMDPVEGWFWRTFDLTLLVFSLTHGILGARYSIEDYFHNRALKFLLLAGAALTWLGLMLLGAFIIFTFNAS